MAFYSFTSSDSGAPTLSGTNGDGITLLDWVLVTKGGWTKVYSGTNKGVYQAPSGNQFVLRAVHDSAVSGSAQRMTVRGAESASDVDTLTDPFPTVALEANSEAAWTMSTASSATTRSYFGVVTSTGVWLAVLANGDNACFVGWFGDLEPTISTDAYCTAITVNGQAGNSSSYFFSMPSAYPATTQPRMYWARDVNGTAKSTYGGPGRQNAQTAFGDLTATHSGAVAAPHPKDSKYHRRRVHTLCYGGNSSTSGTYAMPVRAWWPQLWDPMHSQSLITSGDVFSDTAYNASATFKLMSSNASAAATGSFAILETSDTWNAPSD